MITSKYYLQNQDGTRLSLNVGDDFYLTEVAGLGTTTEDTYTNIQNGFFPISKNGFGQESIEADIVFFNNAFENYRTMVNWLMSASSVDFVYCPYGETEYNRKVKLSSLSKGIRDSAGTMTATIEFMCLSPWYLEVPVPLEFNKGESSFRFNSSRYGNGNVYTNNLAGTFSAEVQNTGHLDAAVEITFNSTTITNPVITATGIDTGTEYGRCAIEYTLGAGDKLILSTQYLDSCVKLIRNGTETDLLPFVDLTNNPFFRMPVKEKTRITITSEDVFSGSASVNVYLYFRSV